MQDINQRYDILFLLVATMHGNDVGIRVVFTTFNGNRIVHWIQPGVDGVVGVNHHRIAFVVVIHLR